MLKVFLVEDEFVVRNGIKNNIEWHKEGFEFCGDAPDGELAYQLIQDKQPDIIITDIKMPFMNGLELSRLIKNEFPQSKIIILSGHEEFTYAQEAIKIGVTEYLLKPINGAKLLEAVKRVEKQILDERKENENLKMYKKEIERNQKYAKRQFFERIITGSLSTIEVLEAGKELGIEIGAQYYQVVLFKYEFENGNNDDIEELGVIREKIKEINNKYQQIIFFERVIEGDVLLIKGSTLKEIEKICKDYLEAVKVIFLEYQNINYVTGIGTTVNRLKSLSESYESASIAFANGFISRKMPVVTGGELSKLMYEDKTSSNSMVALGDLDIKKAEGFLKNGEIKEIPVFVEGFLENLAKVTEKSLLFRQYIIMSICFTVINFLKEIGKDDVVTKKLFIEMDKVHEMLLDHNKAKDYIINLFNIAMEQRDIIRTKRYHRMIEQATDYINQNYFNEDISLNDVAEYMNISPSHFSTVFRRETGRSFIRYLTDVRMNKAKELLKCTDLLCVEISMAVGYRDAQYFSYLFKKENKCTPIQYRIAAKD